MQNFKLYYIKDEYIKFISEFDKKVLYNKNGTRPYIGIVFIQNDITYFAPLSSPKPKHLLMSNKKPDIYKIKDGELGIINLNNMVPTPKSELILINMESQENQKYIKLLKEQINFLNNRKFKVVNKAKKLYKLYKENNLISPIKNRCCNFMLLETKYEEWENRFLEKEVKYERKTRIK